MLCHLLTKLELTASASIAQRLTDDKVFQWVKQNPHTEINPLAVTAKILSQPGIQLCVATAAVQSMQTGFHRLHERLPWLVQHSFITHNAGVCMHLNMNKLRFTVNILKKESKLK